jgi:putative transposase
VIQRGHNRQIVFANRADYDYYLDTLQVWKTRLGVKVYAFCLMTNHVHLILEPGAAVEALAQLMKRMAARQTRYTNRLVGRTGTLWESRYKSSPIETDRYLLACCRYVELNPVRARLVTRPEDYPWSSYGAKIKEDSASWLDRDPCYAGLGPTAQLRAQRYQAFVNTEIPAGEWEVIRHAVQRGQLTGDHRFVDEVAGKIGKRVALRGPGRPRKPRQTDANNG